MSEKTVGVPEHKTPFAEVLCVFFWFLMDGCWLMEWIVPTILFSFVAIGFMGILVFWNSWGNASVSRVAITMADFSWLMMNSFWALSDLAERPSLKVDAQFFLNLGLACCVIAYGGAKWKGLEDSIVLGRLRVRRYFRR